MDGPLYLSHSRLASYEVCGERYRLIYVERVPQVPQGAFLGGSAVHAVIEESERTEAWRMEEPEADEWMTARFLEVFDAAVAEVGGVDRVRWGGRKDRDGRPGEDATWWRRHAGPLFLRRYRALRREDEQHGLAGLPDVEVEVSATLDLDDAGEPVLIKGYIDALILDAPDGPIIRDWKTGTYIRPFQLAVYSWLLERTLGLTANRGEIIYLRGSSRDKWVRTYDLAAWRDLVPRVFRDLVTGIRAGLFPLRPSHLCASCVVQPYCSYGRTIADDVDV